MDALEIIKLTNRNLDNVINLFFKMCYDPEEPTPMPKKKKKKKKFNNSRRIERQRLAAFRKNKFPINLQKEIYRERRIDGMYDHRCREEARAKSEKKERRYESKFDNDPLNYWTLDKFENYTDFIECSTF